MKFNLTNNEPFEVIRTADDKNVDVLNLKTSDLTNDSGFANWPIVQDERTSAVDAITADAPFATLTDGQRVTLHLKQDMANSSTINLTLSGGTTTGAKSLYASYQSTALNTTWDTIKADTYIDLVYEASNNRWVLIGQRDTNSTYSAMTQAEITDGTVTTGRTITPSMLRDNFYTETEIDTLISNNTLKYTVKEASNSTVSFTTSSKMSPNTVYVVGSVSSSILSFTAVNSISIANGSLSNDIAINWSSSQASITNNLVVPTYQILFKASSSFSSITLPSTVKWKDSLAPDANDMKNNYCELTIMNGIATMNIVIV